MTSTAKWLRPEKETQPKSAVLNKKPRGLFSNRPKIKIPIRYCSMDRDLLNFLYRMCKRAAMTTISQVLTSTPFCATLTPQCSQGASPWTPETPLQTSKNASAIDTYNAAINEIALPTPGVSREPLLFQLKIPWDEAREADKKKIIEKASEDCPLCVKQSHPRVATKYARIKLLHQRT